MARFVDSLVVGKVIGDVIDMFVPSVDMAVLYVSRQVSNGCQMKPSATALAPDIEVSDKNVTNELFTLVMTDPDAPSPSEPSMREWVHCNFATKRDIDTSPCRIVTDIPGQITESTSGHMLLKEQVISAATKGKEVIPYMGPRPPIEYGLGLPVAATYLNAQKEPGHRRR